MPLEARYLCGSDDPIGGWISYGYSLRTPAPQLSLCTRGPAPFRNVTVIAPEGVTVSGSVTEERVSLVLGGERQLELTVDGDHITVK